MKHSIIARIAIVCAALLCPLGLFFAGSRLSASASADEAVALVVKASPASPKATSASFGSKTSFERMLGKATSASVFSVPVTDTYVSYGGEAEPYAYSVDESGDLYDASGKLRLEPREPDRRRLLDAIAELRAAHYGRLLPWEEARTFIPKMAKFDVIDLESGLSFGVQRRAGSSHADVQPLTREDTAVMKRIYGGEWSWRRRAILVRTDGAVLAASMHGKPHGGDGIPDNGFSGHFCIHFLGSTTHKSRSVDPEHQLMVYKAAGKVAEYVGAMPPDVVVNTFIKSYNLREIEIARRLLADARDERFERYLERVDRIVLPAKGAFPRVEAEDELTADVPRIAKVVMQDDRSLRTKLLFRLVRTSPIGPWKIRTFESAEKSGKSKSASDYSAAE